MKVLSNRVILPYTQNLGKLRSTLDLIRDFYNFRPDNSFTSIQMKILDIQRDQLLRSSEYMITLFLCVFPFFSLSNQ